MNEKEIYRKVILYTALITFGLGVIFYFIFKDVRLLYGLFIGSTARIIGFVAIIINSYSIIEDGKNSYKSTAGYIGRLIFYGIMIYGAIMLKADIFGLLIGFSIMSVMLFAYQYLKKGGK